MVFAEASDKAARITALVVYILTNAYEVLINVKEGSDY